MGTIGALISPGSFLLFKRDAEPLSKASRAPARQTDRGGNGEGIIFEKF